MSALFSCFQYVFCLKWNVFGFGSLNPLERFEAHLHSELIHESYTLNNFSFLFFRNLNQLYKVLWLWCFLLILTTFNHLFLPLGLSLGLVYHIAYWLSLCALGFFLSPFLCFPSLILAHVDGILRTSCYLHLPFKGGTTPGVFSHRQAFVEKARGGNYRKGVLYLLEDLFCLTSMLRGFHPCMNWVYQMTYLGSRLWLVFILHSFCISCFAELFSVAVDNLLFLAFPLGGFLGLGIFLSLLMIGYLFIQIYVYISFSVTFLFSTTLAYFRNDFPSSLDVSGPQAWLIPVSLVDFAPSHIFAYLFLVILFCGLGSARVWWSKGSSQILTYQNLYKNLV